MSASTNLPIPMISGDAEHILSFSSGKDSGGSYLRALESETEFRAVLMDTDNEHELVYEYAEYLPAATGGPKIEVIKADFSARFPKKRETIATKWPEELIQDVPGVWELHPSWRIVSDRWPNGDPGPAPREPYNRYRKHTLGPWTWRPARKGMTPDEAAEHVATAIELLHPTGNAFLDLCLLKGRFPSAKARFCTEELKVIPQFEQVTLPLLEAGKAVVSWQGVRAEESLARSLLPEFQRINPPSGAKFDRDAAEQWEMYAYRPLLNMTTDEVFDLYRRHGVKWNPLYDNGMTRVGCMPCIMCKKKELREIAKRFPEHIDRIERWEMLVAKVSKLGISTMFAACDDPMSDEHGPVSTQTHGIRNHIQWSFTSRGGRQYEMDFEKSIIAAEYATACNQWGACG